MLDIVPLFWNAEPAPFSEWDYSGLKVISRIAASPCLTPPYSPSIRWSILNLILLITGMGVWLNILSAFDANSSGAGWYQPVRLNCRAWRRGARGIASESRATKPTPTLPISAP
jgi:hypothetical protein